MLIDLFKEGWVKTNSNRLGNQVLTRAFNKIDTLEKLESMNYDNPNFIDYKLACRETVGTNRMPVKILDNTYDNLYELELLGIADSRPRVYVVDLSECLDMVLSILTGCPTEAVRRLPNYREVSKAIMNFDLESCNDLQVADIIGLDSSISTWFTTIIYDNRKDVCADNLNKQDVVYLILFEFYKQILKTVENMKNYVLTYCADFFSGANAAVRSKSRTAVICATSYEDSEDEDVILQYRTPSGLVVTSKAKAYNLGKFEYAKRLGEGTIGRIR